MKNYNEIMHLFEQANNLLLRNDHVLFENQVSERTLCGALMLHIHDIIKDDHSYAGYYADVEYNRRKGKRNCDYKTIPTPNNNTIRITCDLILHGRGKQSEQDNLLAIEMKKSTRTNREKNSDRERLKILTEDFYNNKQMVDTNILPEHVCGYVLGVYYEINYRRNMVLVEYYYKGELLQTSEIQI